MKHWRLVYLAIPLMIFVFFGIMCVNGQKSPELCEGIGRTKEIYMVSGCADEAQTDEYELDHYTEGQGEAPVWWDPEEDMAVEWTDNTTDNARLSESNTQRVIDVGCPDYNVDYTIYGWDGHCMEAWEMDLFSRVFYLEFWGTSDLCCRAGADAMLRLWDSGEYGSTMGQSLSAVNYFGDWVYSTYPEVWNTKYDPDGLAWCREFVEERFHTGIEFLVMYFQLGGYHDTTWSVPVMEVDGVYFSAEKGW